MAQLAPEEIENEGRRRGRGRLCEPPAFCPGSKKQCGTLCLPPPQSSFVVVLVLVLGHGRLPVEEVCAERKRPNGGCSGWLSLLPKRSRTKDDDEDEDDYANRPRPRVEGSKKQNGTICLPPPQSSFVLVLGHGRLPVEEVCAERKRPNGGCSGWLSLLPKRSRTRTTTSTIRGLSKAQPRVSPQPALTPALATVLATNCAILPSPQGRPTGKVICK